MVNNKPKVLVTGAAGYIGSVLVQRLARAGYPVVALDNFHYQQEGVIEVVNKSCKKETQPKWICGDVRNDSIMKEALDGVEYIIPLAAIVGAPACEKDPNVAREVNFDAIAKLVSMRSAVQKIIFPNTNSGYGRGTKGIAFCTEESVLDPISLYGELKVAAEKLLLREGNAIVLRLATVFGVSPRPRLDLLVNNLVYRAWMERELKIYEGHFKRNYIHVIDVARAFMFMIENFPKAAGSVFNLGLSSANLSKRELCEEIRKQIPELKIEEDFCGTDPDQRNYIVSNEKIENLGFCPTVDLQQGIAELIAYYRSSNIDDAMCRNY